MIVTGRCEFIGSLLQKLFKPALPNDAAVSFYIQGHKLVLAVYHLCTNQLSKVDIAARYQVSQPASVLHHTPSVL